jgi:uncharacterized membrane protein YjgN (DUF898 family)
MDEPGRKEPHAGENPYAYSGAADTAANAAAQRPAPAAAGRYPVEFTAAAGEYFRIWIVNLALTILTLGIYSAWAKVRKKRYFYSHTLIDGDSFEYRAVPLAILKGRLIAVGALALFYGVGQFAPSYKWALFVAGAFALPWLLVRSMAFNAYNTAYRNVRLHFRGTFGECFKIIVGYGLLTIVTAGIGYIYLKIRLVRFAADNHYYGTTQFHASDLKSKLVRIYSNAIGLGILSVLALFAVGVVIGTTTGKSVTTLPVLRGIVLILSYIAYLYIFAYLRAGIANSTFNSLSVGSVRFEFGLRAGELFRLYLVNIIAMIATLGLATPWAVVRTLRYRADKATVLAADGLDRFVAAESAQVSATGEEVGEMFDVDFGL